MAGSSNIDPVNIGKPVVPATQMQRNIVKDERVEKEKLSPSNGNSSGNSGGILGSLFQSPKDLNAFETREKHLKSLFNFLVTPFSALSTITSLGTFVMKHFFDKENDLLEKASTVTNKISYFINGLYGGVDNNCTNNIVGAIGYSLVSLASIVGNSENMYYLKGPGSATDQLPAMNEELGYNKGIQAIERFNVKKGEEKKFNRYKDYRDSVDKTFTGMGVICKDIYNGLKEKIPNGIFKAFWDVFFKNERKAERHLLTSSLGMYLGSSLGIFPQLRRIGSIIRDIFAFQADIGIFAKGFSVNKKGDEIGSNRKYMYCGAIYGLGSIGDLIYRITRMEKLNLAAVGLDNAGFWFMNWANADDNRAARLDAFLGGKKEIETPKKDELLQGTPLPAFS